MNIDEAVLEWNFNKATAHICSKHFEEEYLKAWKTFPIEKAKGEILQLEWFSEISDGSPASVGCDPKLK